ncbi:hypothetical protein BGW42_006775 [Actinomortierella wolfii]|nr:hypothetical protein BGW42_006775 [Actinomortierella wolfii]
MTMMHPGHSDGQILQRFRGMTSLHIHPKTANGNDENLLDWAVCEAEHFHHQQGNLQSAPLIQLKELSIEYRDNSRASQLRHVTPKWKILQDALLGFSNTLSRLRVIYPHFGNGMTDLAFTISRPLPKLKSLTLEGLAIDRSVWEQAPNIEEMDIRFEITPSRYNNPLYHSQYLQYDENAGVFSTSSTTVDATTTTTTTPVPTEQQPQQQLFELWFHCPNLTQLTLKGHAAILLDPNCFHLSPNLQKLEISIWEELSHIAQEAQKPLHPTRWTWDWPFPVLRFLTLEGDLRELMFTMGSAHFNEGFGDRELIEITKNHPSLEYVYTYMARTTEPPSALGLLEIGYLDRKVSSNQETTVVEDNHNTPKERTEIVYTFGYDRYILCV